VPEDTRLQLLKECSEAHGIVGFEDDVRALVRRWLEGYGEFAYDGLGSILCTKVGAERPRVMLAGHIDEIGFLVKLVTKEGFVRFTPVGGWSTQVLLAQRVIVKTRQGEFLGVIGSKPPHLLSGDERSRAVKIEDMFIDIGAESKEEAEERFGVRPGDSIVPLSSFATMRDGELLVGKAWDDRVGVALAIEILREAGDGHPNTLIAVGTVAEEMGLRGAKTSPWTAQPDCAIILESAIAGDVPGVKAEESIEHLGKGPTLFFRESGALPSRQFREFALRVAEEEGVPVQHGFLERGSTDGNAIALHQQGVPVLVLGVPARYIHSHSQVMSRADYENALKLCLAMAHRLDAETVASFTAW